MATLSYTVPVPGTDLNSVADPEIATALSTILTFANGNIDATNLLASAAQSAGMNQAGQTVKGAVNIATSQSTSSTSFVTLATPDQITGIVLPANGLIYVWYQAIWQASVGAGSAAIFLNANQVQFPATSSATAPSVQAATTAGANAINALLVTSPGGLVSAANTSNYTGDVTTGQILGFATSSGPCVIEAAAGSYTVAVMFKASSGSVTASSRKLWVEAKSFA